MVSSVPRLRLRGLQYIHSPSQGLCPPNWALKEGGREGQTCFRTSSEDPQGCPEAKGKPGRAETSKLETEFFRSLLRRGLCCPIHPDALCWESSGRRRLGAGRALPHHINHPLPGKRRASQPMRWAKLCHPSWPSSKPLWPRRQQTASSLYAEEQLRGSEINKIRNHK